MRSAYTSWSRGARQWRSAFSPIDKDHRHLEIEFCYMVDGQHVRSFGRHSYTISSGELAVYWAIVPHRIKQVEEGAIGHVVYIPTREALEWNLPHGFIKKILSGKFIKIQANKTIRHSLNELSRLPHDSFNELEILSDRLLFRAHVTRIAEICSDSDQSDKEATHLNHLHHTIKMLRYLLENSSEQMQASDLGRITGLHPNYAQQVFSSMTGMTFVEFLTQRRLEAVEEQLLSTKESVLEIATSCGFASSSQFYKVFKNNYGKTPLEFRRFNHDISHE